MIWVKRKNVENKYVKHIETTTSGRFLTFDIRHMEPV
uniref:Uncharacterized protein n=1 Tax=Arundo donax TaxID=35708 RepID=A0A0A9CZU1_ARUDO